MNLLNDLFSPLYEMSAAHRRAFMSCDSYKGAFSIVSRWRYEYQLLVKRRDVNSICWQGGQDGLAFCSRADTYFKESQKKGIPWKKIKFAILRLK